ncbi:SHOCT domain-containing protein [Haloprofundus halobius]|uniref:SHOCT domain-containing protein n=1 Tax=Haloprofundus halobius TaxID=2876194 RepID=UPI001CCB44EC|nr:SHOCT domain-containing protein [Haloprofundus halobius]
MSGSPGWLRRHSLGITFLALVVVSVSLLGVVGLGALVALASLGQPLGAFAAALFPWAAGAVVLTVLTVVFGFLFAWSLVRRARLRRDERLRRRQRRLRAVAAEAEARNGWLASLNLSSRLGPDESKEDRIEALKRRYASGELSEAEFEHRLDRLMDDGGDRRPRARNDERETERLRNY